MIGLVLFWIACILYAYWLWRQHGSRSDKEPPGFPGALPLIGHAHLLIGDSSHLWRAMQDLTEKSYPLGGAISASIGPRTIYVLTDPDDSMTVANTCLEKDGFYEFAKPWLGEGLVTGKLSIWRNHRKLLNPAFSQLVLDGFLGVFNKQARRLVKDLEAEVGRPPFDHWIYTRHNALETICLTALGVDFTDTKLLNSKYVHATEEMFNVLVERFQNILMHNHWMYGWTSLKKKQEELLKTLHSMSYTTFYTCSLWANVTQGPVNVLRVQYNNGFRMLMGLPRFCSASGMFAQARTDDFYAIMRKRTASMLGRLRASSNSILKMIAEDIDSPMVLQRRRSEMNGNVIQEKEKLTEKKLGSKFKPFLDLLLELTVEKGAFNDQEIREQVDTMIVGGHDTSASVLMYTLLMVGSYPEVQERIVAELKEVFGDSDRDADKHDLCQLVYLEAVIKECMRVIPIVPIVARHLDRDVKLKNYTLSAGRTCFIFLYGINRHPIWGEDAQEFKPERWLDPTTMPEHPTAFAGFSMGKRHCIGKAYALMSMKTTLAHLLRHYKVKGDWTKLEMKLDVMLKPVSGHHISIERRKA